MTDGAESVEIEEKPIQERDTSEAERQRRKLSEWIKFQQQQEDKAKEKVK